MNRKQMLVIVALIVVIAGCLSLFGDDRRSTWDIQNGDTNMDGQICMDDSIQIIYHLWRDGRDLPCPDAADGNRNGYIDVGDVLGGLRYVFFGEPIFDCPITCTAPEYQSP